MKALDSVGGVYSSQNAFACKLHTRLFCSVDNKRPICSIGHKKRPGIHMIPGLYVRGPAPVALGAWPQLLP